MKTSIALCGIIVLIVGIYSFYQPQSQKSEAEEYVWKYAEGYTIGDIIGFNDSISEFHQIDSSNRIFKKGIHVANLIMVSNSQLVIQSLHEEKMGYYKPYVTAEEDAKSRIALRRKNAQLNKEKIAEGFSGIVQSKNTMSNGCIALKLSSNIKLASCWFHPSMDSVIVGDSLNKEPGKNECLIYRDNGRIIKVIYINPSDTISE